MKDSVGVGGCGVSVRRRVSFVLVDVSDSRCSARRDPECRGRCDSYLVSRRAEVKFSAEDHVTAEARLSKKSPQRSR